MIVFRNCAVLLVIGSICSFLYGIFQLHVEVEPNACRMTYMFGQPMFAVRIIQRSHCGAELDTEPPGVMHLCFEIGNLETSDAQTHPD